jgi:hypothetical protein
MPAEAPKAAPMGPLRVKVIVRMGCCWWVGSVGWMALGLHPEEGAGSVLAELEFGDVVAVGSLGLAFLAPEVRCFAN